MGEALRYSPYLWAGRFPILNAIVSGPLELGKKAEVTRSLLPIRRPQPPNDAKRNGEEKGHADDNR